MMYSLWHFRKVTDLRPGDDDNKYQGVRRSLLLTCSKELPADAPTN